MQYPSLLQNEPLSKHCSYRIGGPARYFYVASKLADLKEVFLLAKKEDLKVFLLGSGTNVLFSDKGFDGLVLKNECDKIDVEGNLVRAEGGAPLSKVILTARKAGLTGLEPWWGMPGTVGAAVRGNAGSFGLEVKDVLQAASILKDEQEFLLNNKEFEFAYRDSKIKREGGLVLEAGFELQKAGTLPDLEDFLGKRKEKQPTGVSCGSFFKNPPGDKSAGQLIDEAGLKGLKIGGAQVSRKHANFLLNIDNASFTDMMELKEKVKEVVRERFGVELEEEVVIV